MMGLQEGDPVVGWKPTIQESEEESLYNEYEDRGYVDGLLS
jgi:hypothetical protein